MAAEPRLAWDVAAELGEGPVWVERDAALWFTDIKRRQIHRLSPASGERRSWHSPEQVGFVMPREQGGFIAGLQSGLHRFDENSGAFELLAEIEPERPGNRLNDAVVDPAGRLWFGTMDNEEGAKSGSYYCYARGRVVHSGLSGITITNGPAVSPDGSLLYWVDTLGRAIHVCDIAADGTLGQSRLFAAIPEGEGNPDGPSVDSTGHLWVGFYGGWEARRFSPAGELVERVRFPVANVTKVAFGGADLRTAYATTARHLLSPEQLADQPLAGGLFEFPVDVPGIPTRHVDG